MKNITRFIFLVVLSLQWACTSNDEKNKVEPSNAGEIAVCNENHYGMSLIVRNALATVKNPLADHVDKIHWPQFCDCIGPKQLVLHATLTPETKKQPDWYSKFLAKRDALAVECALANNNFSKTVPPSKK